MKSSAVVSRHADTGLVAKVFDSGRKVVSLPTMKDAKDANPRRGRPGAWEESNSEWKARYEGWHADRRREMAVVMAVTRDQAVEAGFVPVSIVESANGRSYDFKYRAPADSQAARDAKIEKQFNEMMERRRAAAEAKANAKAVEA